MSKETWEDEFYPLRASDCNLDIAGDHALLKFSGLRKHNLERHRMRIALEECKIVEIDNPDNYFMINAMSCVWCLHAIENCEGKRNFKCDSCPAIQAGMRHCDGKFSPFETWMKTGDPEPMIEWIKEAKEKIENV